MKRKIVIAVAVCALLGAAAAGPALAANRVVTETDRQARPGVAVNVWGAATNNGAGNLGDGSANGEAYTWSFAANPNVTVNDDGNLSGVVGSDKFIVEQVSFTLLGGSTRELITATLTVNGTPSSNSVTFDIVDPADPISATPLDNLAIEVNVAIAQGNERLLQTQQASGCWSDASWSSPFATTGFSLWALENGGHLPTDDPNQDAYVDFVARGLNCLQGSTAARGTFANRADVPREATGAQVTDLNSNGQSVQVASGEIWPGYSHPIATAAFISSLDTGSYQALVEDAIDYIGFLQSPNAGFQPAFGRGGWDYNGPSDRSDYSINSWNWMAIEGGSATAFGIDAPDWILQESEYTLISHQTNPPNQPVGQPFGYDDDVPLRGYSEGHATTCAGLSGLAAVELENTVAVGSLIAGQPAPLNSIATRRQAALDWLGDLWANDSNGALGDGNRNNYYSMWTCCRALRLTEDALGIGTDTLTLDNGGVSFNWSTGEENASGNVPGAGAPREGYSPWLVRNQQLNGSWASGTYLGTNLETPLALLCLNPTVFGPPMADCPEDPDPRTQGYWHRQCLGLPESEGGIDPGRNGRGPQSPTEPDFQPDLMTCAETELEAQFGYFIATCEGMDADPPSDKCEKALKQTTALILNVCSGRLEDGCSVDVSSYGCSSTDVGSLIDELAMLIQMGDCQTASACADAVNSGEAPAGGGGFPSQVAEEDGPSLREVSDTKQGKSGRR